MDGKLILGVVGLKGAIFLNGLLERGVKIDRVFSYNQTTDKSMSLAKIQAICASKLIEFCESKNVKLESSFDIVMFVGWQFLTDIPRNSVIVFHDSILPNLRGFSPTVSALQEGHKEIGVSAIHPDQGVDTGPILGQKSVTICYPIKIAEALEVQSILMVDLAVELTEYWRINNLIGTIQSEEEATYSLWRDDEDYWIDWKMDAEYISRFVDAVGYPYANARTRVGVDEVHILDASPVADLNLVNRQPGKIWQLDAGCPIVVCGSGMIRLDKFQLRNGEQYEFRRLRVRLGA